MIKKILKRLKRLKNSPLKKLLIPLGIIFLILVTLFLLKPSPKTYTFEEGFNELKEIDKKYGTDFKQEMLNSTIINHKNIRPLIEEITIFRESIKESSKEKPNNEEKALLDFTEIRMLMLRSQQNFQLAEAIGKKGLVTDEQGFSCAEAGYIINAAYYYNNSYEAGTLAYIKTDDILTQHKDVSKLRELVGIEETRPKFYLSPLGWIHRQIRKNIFALENYCTLNISQGLHKVNPEDYTFQPQGYQIPQEPIEEPEISLPENITKNLPEFLKSLSK